MPPETDRARPLYGALAGLLTGAVAVGVGQLVASIGAQNSSPFVAVGDASIGLAPAPVKNFAITEFGSHDKPVLLIGIGVVLAIFAAGDRRPRPRDAWPTGSPGSAPSPPSAWPPPAPGPARTPDITLRPWSRRRRARSP